jgi:hypothetical protein
MRKKLKLLHLASTMRRKMATLYIIILLFGEMRCEFFKYNLVSVNADTWSPKSNQKAV